MVQLGFSSRLPPTVHRVQLTNLKNTPAPIFQFAPDSNPKPNSNLIQKNPNQPFVSSNYSNGRSASSSEIIGRGPRARNGLAHLKQKKSVGIGRPFQSNFNLQAKKASKIPVRISGSR